MVLSESRFLKIIIAFFFFISFYSASFAQEHASSQAEKDTSSLRYKLLTKGVFHAHARSFFMATDNQDALTDYYALAFGAGISYESYKIHGFQFGLTGFFIFNLESSDLGTIDPSAKSGNRYEIGLFDLRNPNNKSDLDRLEDLYLRYNWRKSKIEAGRFELNTPFINRQDGRMRGTIEEGVWAEFNEVKDFKIEGAWIHRISPRSTIEWYKVEDSYGVYPGGLNEFGNKSDYAGNIRSAGVGLLGLTYLKKKVKIQLWDQFAENVFNTAMVRADLNLPVGSITTLQLGAMYVRQDALNYGGNEDQTKTYISKGSYSTVISTSAGLKHGNLEASLNYTHIPEGDRFLMPREWGREPFYTFMPRERNEGYADVNAAVAKLSYSFFNGRLKPSLGYGHFYLPDVKDVADNKYGLPSYNQLNADIRYSFAGYLKGLSMQMLMVYKGALGETYNESKYVFNKVNMVNWNVVVDYTF
jgi:hypothetical protein